MPEIRRGDFGDLAEIEKIQKASPESSQWAPADYLAYDLRVACCDGAVAGFLAARRNGPDEWEILNVAVAPEWRRRGVARRLIEHLQRSVTGCVFLEVRESNRAARKLYNSMGFQEVSLRQQYYNSPPEAAIVMKFHSC